jgi:hypothetical protein
MTQVLPGQVDEILSPEPFNEAFWSDFVDHHLPDHLKVVKAFERGQEGLGERS